jgi:hypothetical protein
MYKKNIKNNSLDFIALVDVNKESEILVNYNGNPNDKSEIWFDVI